VGPDLGVFEVAMRRLISEQSLRPNVAPPPQETIELHVQDIETMGFGPSFLVVSGLSNPGDFLAVFARREPLRRDGQL
jgi:hypothetical protein